MRIHLLKTTRFLVSPLRVLYFQFYSFSCTVNIANQFVPNVPFHIYGESMLQRLTGYRYSLLFVETNTLPLHFLFPLHHDRPLHHVCRCIIFPRCMIFSRIFRYPLKAKTLRPILEFLDFLLWENGAPGRRSPQLRMHLFISDTLKVQK